VDKPRNSGPDREALAQRLRDGRKHRELGRFDLARRDAIAALLLDPTNAEALALRTQCDEALAAARNARLSSPRPVPPPRQAPPLILPSPDDFEDAATSVAPMLFDDDHVFSSTSLPQVDSELHSDPDVQEALRWLDPPANSAPGRPGNGEGPMPPIAALATPIPQAAAVESSYPPVANYQTPLPGSGAIFTGYPTQAPPGQPVAARAERLPWRPMVAAAVIMATGVILGRALFSGGSSGTPAATTAVPVSKTPPTAPPTTPTTGKPAVTAPVKPAAPSCPGAPHDPGTEKEICPPPDKPVVFFSPHPDDETLTMGGGIAEAVASGRPVFIELLTRGTASPVREILSDGKTHRWHPGRHEYNLTPEQIGEARVREFADAAQRLGVTGVYISDFADGKLTAEDVASRIRWWLDKKPSVISLHGTYTGGSDHEVVWKALLASGHADVTGYSYDSEHYSSVTSFPSRCEKKSSSLEAYEIWDPKSGRYAIGRHSVGEFFADARKDCREYIVKPGEPADPTSPGSEPAPPDASAN